MSETIPADIAAAIEVLCRAEGALGNLALTGRNYQRAITVSHSARAALDAAILKHLRGYAGMKAAMDAIASGAA